VEAIQLSVSVMDGRNRYVGGLSERDFAVFEDGARQELAYFTGDPLPLSVALLVDCSASMDKKLGVAQEAGSRFIRALGPDDLAQVVQFNDRITPLQGFTADQRALEAAIRSTRASGPTVLYTALYVTLKELRSHGSPQEPRRRAIVLLSDGEDTASSASDDQVLELARQTEIAVYSISLRPESAWERQRIAAGQAAHFLTVLGRETGGQAFFPDSLSDVDAIYGRIAEELRAQYTLGYVSSNTRRDGKWRRIVVRPATREELQLRHKTGYYGPKG
jgi:Ca-activated chloride channel family protein